ASALSLSFGEEFSKAAHGRLVGNVDPQRRYRDMAILDRGHIGASLEFERMLHRISDPVIRITPPVHALVDIQPFLPAAPQLRNRTFDLFRPAVRKIDIDEDIAADAAREYAANDVGAK